MILISILFNIKNDVLILLMAGDRFMFCANFARQAMKIVVQQYILPCKMHAFFKVGG